MAKKSNVERVRSRQKREREGKTFWGFLIKHPRVGLAIIAILLLTVCCVGFNVLRTGVQSLTAGAQQISYPLGNQIVQVNSNVSGVGGLIRFASPNPNTVRFDYYGKPNQEGLYPINPIVSFDCVDSDPCKGIVGAPILHTNGETFWLEFTQ